MHFTATELTNYILHKDSSLSREDAQKKTDTFLRWVAKKRSISQSKVFHRDMPVPKRDTSIKWKGRTVEELKEIEDSLSKL